MPLKSSWSEKQKRIARRAFKKAYEREMIEIANKTREAANKANSPETVWGLHDFLSKKRKEIDSKYDFRYSVLITVLARLIREGRIELRDLEGLDKEKIDGIQKLLEL